MALGGGTWIFQNKVLPGAYINFKSASSPSIDFVDRGIGAIALELDWGVEGEIFSVEADAFQMNSTAIFGYEYGHEKLTGLRDLFKNLKTGYFYRLSNGAKKASSALGTAKYAGIRGNDIKLVIESDPDIQDGFIVKTYLDNDGSLLLADEQYVKTKDELANNDYVVFSLKDDLKVTAMTPMTGGTNGDAITAKQHQDFLGLVEPYYYNTLGAVTTDADIKDLYIAFVKRMRDDVGMKFQLVLHNVAKEKADYEGLINIKNNVTDDGASPASLVYWVLGAEASCAVNASISNKTYDGDYTVSASYSQVELTRAINEGFLTFHRVTDPSVSVTGTINVLTDINSFTSWSKSKGQDFSKNQVIRVLDQIAIDIARLFNKQYLGKEPNDDDGRNALWNDIVTYYQELQRIRAIQNFKEEDIPLPKQGLERDAVLVEHAIQPTGVMEKLYMTVTVA